jgi:hypothetical protein
MITPDPVCTGRFPPKVLTRKDAEFDTIYHEQCRQTSMQNGFQPVGRLVGYDLKPRLAGMIVLDETEQFPPPDDCFRYILGSSPESVIEVGALLEARS